MTQCGHSRELDKIMLRFPDGMRDRIKATAKVAGRSMNAEIVYRLQRSLDSGQASQPQHCPASTTPVAKVDQEFQAAHLSFVRNLHPAGLAALAAISAERVRQIETEGWTAEHDDHHSSGEIALAAACYAMFASVSDNARASTELPAGLTVDGKPIEGWAAWLEIWPWERKFWKPTYRRRDLIKAAAMLVAEIERLDRASAIRPESEIPEA